MRRALTVVAAAALLSACGGDDTGAGPNDPAAYCESVRAGQVALAGDVQDPTAAKAAVAAFDRLVKTAPATVKPDVETVADLIDQIAAADPADETAVAGLFAAALDPTFLAASKRMKEFTQQQCGIDLSGATPSLAAPPAGTAS